MGSKNSLLPFLEKLEVKQMKYMLDKIEVHEKKEEILKVAGEIVKILKEDKKLNDSEKLMTIELAVAQLNYDLYGISGDK